MRSLRPTWLSVPWRKSKMSTRTPAWPEMYGLGWFLGTYNGQRAVHHSGTSTGTITRTLFMPDKNFAVVAFVNVLDTLGDEAVMFIIDLYKDELEEI